MHHLRHTEARTGNVRRDPVDAVLTVVNAEVGEQNLEQRHTAPIRRIAVANATACGRPQPSCRSVALGAAAGGTGGVIFGCVSQDGEFVLQFHCINLQLNHRSDEPLAKTHAAGQGLRPTRLSMSAPAHPRTGCAAAPAPWRQRPCGFPPPAWRECAPCAFSRWRGCSPQCRQYRD